MTVRTQIALLFSIGIFGCGSQEPVQPREEVTFMGTWRFVSQLVTDCDSATDNKEYRCSGSAAECGVLTLSENDWSWEQSFPDGSVVTESGTFYLSTNTIILTSPDSPGPLKNSITGWTMMYTRTSLTFINSSTSDGCTYTQTYSRYTQVTTPHG